MLCSSSIYQKKNILERNIAWTCSSNKNRLTIKLLYSKWSYVFYYYLAYLSKTIMAIQINNTWYMEEIRIKKTQNSYLRYERLVYNSHPISVTVIFKLWHVLYMRHNPELWLKLKFLHPKLQNKAHPTRVSVCLMSIGFNIDILLSNTRMAL